MTMIHSGSASESEVPAVGAIGVELAPPDVAPAAVVYDTDAEMLVPVFGLGATRVTDCPPLPLFESAPPVEDVTVAPVGTAIDSVAAPTFVATGSEYDTVTGRPGVIDGILYSA